MRAGGRAPRWLGAVLVGAVWLWVLASAVPAGGASDGAAERDAGLAAEPRPGAGLADPERLLRDQLRTLDLQDFSAALDRLNAEVEDYLPRLDLEGVIRLLLGRGEGLSPGAIAAGLVRYGFREVVLNGRLLAGLVLLAVVAAVLQSVQAGLEGQQVEGVAYAAVYLVLVGVALSGFAMAMEVGRRTVGDLVEFMLAIVPLLVALLAGTGAVVSAGLFHPLLIFVVNATAVLVRDVVYPLIFAAAALELISSASGRFRLTGLAGLLKQVALIVTSLALAVFLGVVAVQGAAGAVADGVTLRTAKYLVGFVPVLGGVFSDAVEVVVSSSLLLKNAVGVLGLVAVFVATAFPLVKMVSVALVFRLAGGLIQPLFGVGQSPVVEALERMAGLLLLAFAAAASVGLMFFLALTMILAAGNAAVMFR